MSAKSIFQEEKNPRGIPKAPFIANVEEYLGGPDGVVETPLKNFQDAIAKYRYMDANLTQRRKGLEDKIPDIRKTLHMVEFLQERREGKNKNDDLEDDLKAELEDTDTVYLWLGVIAEAASLLRSKLDLAEASLKATIEDLEFLREQLTVMEVNTARVYNWDVKRRRERRLAGETNGKKGG
ncbi:Prefoldin subunit 3 [Suillus subalutaceus]|uniref:Prefoldin subunit 3 n=1 Tax=Suillus subalutaceus TaxID=48586 RepID=UPI001B8640DE|nr:Prefoldin subunit 3 [Suillus subalutaceus]KAG1861132.1 Prefoldin subunit 3 [Suillus subalutaceus]